MFCFREKEFQQLDRFVGRPEARAMAVYGKRRTGKTRLITEYIKQSRESDVLFLYYQCTSYDYRTCLKDFLSVVTGRFPEEGFLSAMSSFRDVITALSRTRAEKICIIIDEFPFLAKKDENVPVEFQWIIDHGLGNMQLILLGSNLSFMKKQMGDREAPLYGRFDEMMEIRPFSFAQVQTLFPSLDEAMKVYSMTGGVAQYVMFFLNYPSVREASEALFFSPDGRLIHEAPNMLLQELRDPTTYEQILRGLGGTERTAPQIAERGGLDSRGISPYLSRLQDLHLISPVDNPLSAEKRKQRFRITDVLFRFHYTFIEPNMSLINALNEKAADVVLDQRYQEYLGLIYEDIVRENCFQYALDHRIPFMPRNTGKWWGPVMQDHEWTESEVDLIAYDQDHLLVGECKYRSKAVGMRELENLKWKARFVQAKGRELFFLLASRSGFTEDVEALSDPHVILIDPI